MGIHPNIGAQTFPSQGRYLGQRVRVCFRYDLSQQIGGTVVRDDRQDPWVTAILLDDGRLVLSTECQWSTDAKPEESLAQREVA